MIAGSVWLKRITIVGSIVAVAGCAAKVEHYKRHDSEAPTVQGPPVTDNSTPLEGSFQCMARKIKNNGRERLRVTVGNVKDYTGKFSEAEGGNPITQGGALMVMSSTNSSRTVVQSPRHSPNSRVVINNTQTTLPEPTTHPNHPISDLKPTARAKKS